VVQSGILAVPWPLLFRLALRSESREPILNRSAIDLFWGKVAEIRTRINQQTSEALGGQDGPKAPATPAQVSQPPPLATEAGPETNAIKTDG